MMSFTVMPLGIIGEPVFLVRHVSSPPPQAGSVFTFDHSNEVAASKVGLLDDAAS